MGIENRIRLAIELSNLSLKDAATLCKIPYSSLQNWVNGACDPRSDALISLASHLGVSIDWLLTGQGPVRRNHPQENTVVVPRLSPAEDSLITLFRSVNDDDRLHIKNTILERKRLREMEQRIKDITLLLSNCIHND